jgi:2-polyprenyl-3-methyl-5-hydroxy-6-metoxy-1,4-benzoquinol methylase
MNTLKRTEIFLKYLASSNPIYFKAIRKNYRNNTVAFESLAECMLGWAESLLGEEYLEILASGYVHFVNDVNRSQLKYEQERQYENKSYAEVYTSVYDNSAYMALYHWGVFTTTFAWEHHLKLYQYFVEQFVNRLSDEGNFLDLGSGSGIWSLLMLSNKENWRSTGIDISNYSVDTARQLSIASGFSKNSNFIVEDALKYKAQEKIDAVVSCFLLEHLEEPEKLFVNAADNLKDGGYAFITAALTAAEVDHIFEFRRESDLVKLAEESGFRIISMLSESPATHPRENYFLPRSMALVLQKKINPIW